MKKRICLVLALLLVLAALFACSSGDKKADNTEQTNSETPAQQAVDTKQPEIAETATDQQEQIVENNETSDNGEENPIPVEVLEKPVSVAALVGPTGIGLTYLTDFSNFFTLELFTAPDQVTAKIINGEVDIAAVPVNLASVLYNKTQGAVSVIAVNTLGVLYIVERGETIHSIQDLAGKTIYATGQASTPQYILEQVLAQNGLTDSVTVEFVSDGTELAAKLVNGDVEIAMLPEPQVSVACLQSENTVRVALSMNDLWNENNETPIVQGVYLVRNEYLKEHPYAVARFMEDAALSADKVLNDPDAPAAVVAKGILPKEPIAKRAIPNCNICFVSGSEMKKLVSGMLETLFSANPSSVGGKLPDNEFYYEQNF